ncbi:MAG: folylpolyglutamate synthase/dihydrofolate synthase family protein [Bacteroidales bacterium]
MNYQQTLEFLFSRLPMFQRIGAAAYKADLNTTLQICHRLNQPQNKFKSIHIAGTNGKGSVSHLLASVFQEAGYKTGLFTSPHLKDFRERIKIDGVNIQENYIVNFVEKNIPLIDDLSPSFFEYTFALAITYFAEKKVDVAIMETGMGGRLDSTNVISPELSVITNIGFDHTQFLGDTLQKIAVEKAGITKPGIPVVIGETQETVKDVFVHTAQKYKAKIYFADELAFVSDFSPANRNSSFVKFDAELQGKFKINSLHCPLTGDYQKKNLKTLFGVLSVLNDLDYTFSNDQIRKGIEKVITNTGISGRWQVLKENPLIICDTGHNVDGIKYVVNQLRSMKFSKLHMVIGMVNDKNVNDILSLLPGDATYYFCKANIPRGMDATMLKSLAGNFGLRGDVYDSVSSAYNAATKNAIPNDLIFIGGSTFVVAEIL